MKQTLRDEVIALLGRATESYVRSRDDFDEAHLDGLSIELQIPRNPEHGDWACNVAMRLAKPLRLKPLDIATGIVEQIKADVLSSDLIDSPEAAPPGFINLRVATSGLARTISRVFEQGEDYGKSDLFAGKRVLVEFVSANPTGPLHIGHGRNAVIGDTIARIYAAVGYAVEREYYYNDAGVQMDNLGKTLKARYLEALGFPIGDLEITYKGDYMTEIAEELKREVGDGKIDEPILFFTQYAADRIMKVIDADLQVLDIRFDRYFSETTLHKDNRVEGVLAKLAERGMTYEEEGALFFKSSQFGDDKDRVVRKSDGNTTYLTPDIAYHMDKYERGYARIVNVLGADHHAYVIRLKAAVQALGYDAEALHFVLIQMVGVKEGGEARKLSTRAGDFITLKEILDDTGPEVTRFFFAMRSPESQMEFDVDLAREQSSNNPYWYIQYAHARCCNILAKAEQEGHGWKGGKAADLNLLTVAEERQLIFLIEQLTAAVIESAEKDEPLPLVNYLRDLVAPFHAYYSLGNRDAALRCIQPDQPALNEARLTLIAALQQAVANGLRILGLTPIDRL